MRIREEYEFIGEQLKELYSYERFVKTRISNLEDRLAQLSKLIDFASYLDSEKPKDMYLLKIEEESNAFLSRVLSLEPEGSLNLESPREISQKDIGLRFKDHGESI